MFLSLLIIFFSGSLLGYVFEFFLRRFVTRHKWTNPGFLIGPYLPIYGFGLSIMFLISNFINSTQLITPWRQILAILIIAILMTSIEYIGGIVFIRALHIKLWDYSNAWGNIQGIICPQYSLLWAVFGAIYYFFVHSKMSMYCSWFKSKTGLVVILIIFFIIFLTDFLFSITVLIKDHVKANKNSLATSEEIISLVQQSRVNIRKKIKDFLFFK